MSTEPSTTFLTYYVQSLGERTRDEKRGTRFGFDWIIYNLALNAGWTPYRLPFMRNGPKETSKTKTEAEFGIDLAFLSEDRKTLRIFALKDEVLNNQNWGANSFDVDIRNASTPDLRGAGLEGVESVEVILAYNKDEDHTGVRLFENLTNGLGSKVGDHVRLRFDRWNLTRIVEEVQRGLLTPALLPQKFFSHFSYICAQFADFRHGSDEWASQLVPNWHAFLKVLLSDKADERCIRLLPVALLILREAGKDSPTRETALLDLTEWGMLAAWEVARTSDKPKLRSEVMSLWIQYYLAELEQYYSAHRTDLAVRFSLDNRIGGGFVDTIAAAVLAHWHVARIGILAISFFELLPSDDPESEGQRYEALVSVSDCLIGMYNGNPSCMRPLIDLHHIELFLTWGTLMQVGRTADVTNLVRMLVNRLTVRRFGNAEIPFIEGHNSVALVLEYVASGRKPHEFCDSSSVYLTCLLEIICSFEPTLRDQLLSDAYRWLVQGRSDEGNQINGTEPIDLMLWIPPEDWGEKVLTQSLAHEGECATIRLGRFGNEMLTGEEIYDHIKEIVVETRRKRTFIYPKGIPYSVVLLACIKHRSPLPPEFWRRSVFGDLGQSPEPNTSHNLDGTTPVFTKSTDEPQSNE